MDQEIERKFQELKRLAILNYAEIQELKKALLKDSGIPKFDFYAYANSLGDYLKELDAKTRNLVRDFPEVG